MRGLCPWHFPDCVSLHGFTVCFLNRGLKGSTSVSISGSASFCVGRLLFTIEDVPLQAV